MSAGARWAILGLGAEGTAIADCVVRIVPPHSEVWLVDRDVFDTEGLSLTAAVGPDAAQQAKAAAVARALAPIAALRSVTLRAFQADVETDLGPGWYLQLDPDAVVSICLDSYRAVAAVARDTALVGSPRILVRANISGPAGAQVQTAFPGSSGACLGCTFSDEHLRSAARSPCTGGAPDTTPTRAVAGPIATRLAAALSCAAANDVGGPMLLKAEWCDGRLKTLSAKVSANAHCRIGHTRLHGVTRLDSSPEHTTARALGVGGRGELIMLPGSQGKWWGTLCEACGTRVHAVHFGARRSSEPCTSCGLRRSSSVPDPRLGIPTSEIDLDAPLSTLGLAPHAVLSVAQERRVQHFTFSTEGCV